MNNLKLIAAVGGLTLMLGACARHGTPNYYDADGNKITFPEYRLMVECSTRLGFNMNNENKTTLAKYGNSKAFVIRTDYVGDTMTDMSNLALKKGASPDEVAAAVKDADTLHAGENYVLRYPSKVGVADSQKTPDNLVVKQNCNDRTADYSGPGTETHISGKIEYMSTDSIRIEGNDATTGQSVRVVVERLIPDGTVKGQKASAIVATNDYANGRYTIQITLTKRAMTNKNIVVNQRVVVFRQSVVDDVTTKSTIDTEVAQEYLNALDPKILSDMKSACDPTALGDLSKPHLPQAGVLAPLCAAKAGDKTIDIADVGDLIDLSRKLEAAKNPTEDDQILPRAKKDAPAPAAPPAVTPKTAPDASTPAVAPAAPPASPAAPSAADGAPAPLTAQK